MGKTQYENNLNAGEKDDCFVSNDYSFCISKRYDANYLIIVGHKVQIKRFSFQCSTFPKHFFAWKQLIDIWKYHKEQFRICKTFSVFEIVAIQDLAWPVKIGNCLVHLIC